MMMPGRGGRKLASGIVSVPGPKGAGDIVPAMLSPGEAVIPAEFAKKYAPLIQGMVAGNIPGYQNGNISFGGRSFSVNPRGQVSIQRMIDETKSLSSVIGNIDDLILNALINAENELTAKGKVRAKSLQDQLKARKLIEKAKGILMKNLKINEPEAFKWMQKTAMDKRRSMTDVAQLVMDEFEKN
jgi:hypothetical protein